MENISLHELVGGALQEKFSKSFARVLDNLQDANTPYKNKRAINIKLTFEQNESRDDVKCSIEVQEKLAPQAGLETKFAIGKDLKTGETHVEEYGKYMRGQQTIDDYKPTQVIDGKVVDTDTGEIIGEKQDTVVDFRKAATN